MTVQEQEHKIEEYVTEVRLPSEIYQLPRPTEEQLSQLPSDIHRQSAETEIIFSEHVFPLAYLANAIVIASKVGIFDIMDKPMTVAQLASILADDDKIELDPLNLDQEMEFAEQKIDALFALFSAPQFNLVRQANEGNWELTERGKQLRSDVKVSIAAAMMGLVEYYVKPAMESYPRQVFGVRGYDDIGSPEEGATYTERVPGKVRTGLLMSLPKFGIDLDEGEPLVVDLGCGPAQWCIDIGKKHSKVKVIGLDYNLGSCEMATKKANEEGLGDRLEFRQVDLATDRIPVSDNTVDLVTAINFHHFFPRSGDQNVTNELFRILKPGGKYITIVPFNDGPDDALMLSTQTMFQFLYSGFTGWRTPEHLTEIAQKAGFKITKVVPMIYRGRQAIFFAVKS